MLLSSQNWLQSLSAVWPVIYQLTLLRKQRSTLLEVAAKGESIASRKASQDSLNAYGPLLPELLGGSADLAGSNLTLWKGCKGVSDVDASGNYVFYGVREFGMSAIMNGVALHGGLIPYGATFLMFMEYARNAVHVSVDEQRVLYVLPMTPLVW